jgi:phage shock protein A
MDFFKKLNTLVQAQINDVINPIRDENETTRRRFMQRPGVRSGLEGDVTTLRKRVTEALAYEEKLQKEVDTLYQEISEHDAKADAAVANGQEAEARVALGKMHAAQRRVELIEADLREHRTITQELMGQVSQLEAIVDQAKREQAEAPAYAADKAADAAQKTAAQIKVDIEEDDDDAEDIVASFSEKLDSTRQKLSELIANTTGKPLIKQDEIVEEAPPPPVSAMDRKKVDDDLAGRISRLSKPDDDPKTPRKK